MLKVLWRTLLLLLLSALLLGGMAAYVKLTQHRQDPQAPLDISVTKDILWPGQETELHVHYSGEEGMPLISPPPPPTDLVFLLDSSGSMSHRDLTLAKQELLKFPHDLGQHNQLAVVEFASTARVLVPFTRDYPQLRQVLSTMARGAGGGTRFLQGLRQVLELLQGRPPSTVVMLTDGGANESLAELRDFYKQDWRPSGHELFMVGIGAEGVDPASFLQLTDDPAHYIVRGLDRHAIGEMFREVRERMGNVLGRRGELHISLAEPLWTWSHPQEDTYPARRQPLPASSQETDIHFVGTLFQRRYEWVAPIAPKLGGILTTLADPLTLSYVSATGQRRALSTPGAAPKVLAVTPWLLFLLLLPALLYLLAALLEWLLRRPAPIPELPPIPPIKTYRPPPDLPLHFAPKAQRIRWTPTLVLGLGGSGRHVLTHVRQALSDSLDEPPTRPVLLALDVARDEVEGPRPDRVPGCLAPLDKAQIFLLPPESCALEAAVQQRRTLDDPAWALDLRDYQRLSRDALHLNEGTHGQAPLARLALLNELAAGSKSQLLKRLQAALTEWRSRVPEQRYRQIILIANVHGGVGSGWLSDLLVLLRRLVKLDEQQERAVEISVLLLGDEGPERGREVPLQAPTLFAELDRLASAGRQGFRHCLSRTPGDAVELLDGPVDRRPQDAMFVLPGPRAHWKTHLYPAAADAVCLLLEPRRRIRFTQILQGLQAAENQRRAREGREVYAQLAIHNAVFPRSFFRALLANRLGDLLANRQILFPGLEVIDGQPYLREPTVEAAGLLGQPLDSAGTQRITPGSADQSVLDALREAALGDKTTLQALEPDADVLHHAAHGLRLLLLDNANRLLIEARKLGLGGLLKAARGYAHHLQEVDYAAAQALANDCSVLADQAATWIELFLGTAARRELDDQEMAADREGRYGFAQESRKSCEESLEILQEWQQGDSRLLIGPLASMDLQDKEGCIQRLDEQLHNEFLRLWLGPVQAPVAELAARCHWEVSTPGLQGGPIGISLVLRGMQVRRYVPAPGELGRFQADLLEEIACVVDAESDFHILKLLQSHLEATDSQGLLRFIQGLKGKLRGERSSLLLSLPVVPSAYASEMQELRRALQQTFEQSSGAAELVYSCDDNDRYRMGILQILPLLTASSQPALPQPLHRYERWRRDYADRLAEALNVATVELPPAAGVALQDPERLRQFARLYGAKQVIRWELDERWHLYDGSRWQPLSFLPQQTLADAAAYFVTHKALVAAADDLPVSEPLPGDEEEDFVALLEWLLHTEAAGSVA